MVLPNGRTVLVTESGAESKDGKPGSDGDADDDEDAYTGFDGTTAATTMAMVDHNNINY